MPTRILRQPEHADALADILRTLKLPITVSWTQGAPRSDAQRNLSQRWFTDIAMQLGDQTREDVRAQCKLDHGVPILRAENEAFRLSYGDVFQPLSYEAKLAAIKAFDLPVTRLMTVKQMSAFMDDMQRQYAPLVRLTDPEALKYEMEFMQ
jgi:hypothetical protein